MFSISHSRADDSGDQESLKASSSSMIERHPVCGQTRETAPHTARADQCAAVAACFSRAIMAGMSAEVAGRIEFQCHSSTEN